LAETDDLTGLPNRRCFLTQAERVLRRHGKDLAARVLMMDLDGFSKVNERFGHAGGDEALAWFASLLRRKVTGNDLVARYGGEEFCALLHGADRAQALTIAEAIRASLAADPVPIQGQRYRVTVSIGIASLHGADIVVALQRADQAMYLAKAAGRNCVADEEGVASSRVGVVRD
jgi:diguanylate cyclase (GGDEF)-like protein